MTAESPSEARPWRARAASIVRGALLVVGLALVVYFVIHVGPAKVLAALESAGRFLPLLAALELGIAALDARAYRALLGEDGRRVPLRSWLRSTASAYSCDVLLPAGKTAAEVARASVLGAHVGRLRAARAAAELQAVSLIADGTMSCAMALIVALTLGNTRQLVTLIATNSAFTLPGGIALLVLLHHPAAARWIARRFPRIAAGIARGESAPQSLGVAACAWMLSGRTLQFLQYTVAVFAVGGALGPTSGAVAYGVRIVGATLGMAVPNQVGVTDGAYLHFADELGFGREPARALAVMLSIRAIQIVLALGSLLLPVFLRARAVSPPRESSQ